MPKKMPGIFWILLKNLNNKTLHISTVLDDVIILLDILIGNLQLGNSMRYNTILDVFGISVHSVQWARWGKYFNEGQIILLSFFSAGHRRQAGPQLRVADFFWERKPANPIKAKMSHCSPWSVFLSDTDVLLELAGAVSQQQAPLCSNHSQKSFSVNPFCIFLFKERRDFFSPTTRRWTLQWTVEHKFGTTSATVTIM